MEACLWIRFLMISLLVISQCASKRCRMGPRTCLDVSFKTNHESQVAIMEDRTVHLCKEGGWTVIQRRFKGDTDFCRCFEEYRFGFGDMNGDFWWGLEKIADVTSMGDYELLVTFDFEGQSYYAHYNFFRVFNMEEDYKLQIGDYDGNAGDSLRIHNGMKFTTYDKDNDEARGNCAVMFTGAWWHNKCLDSNLNGSWNSTEFAKGTLWETTTGNYKSTYNIEMKIRWTRKR